jgi:hypothetical protein
MKHLTTFLIVLFSFSLLLGAANQAAMEKSPGKFDPAQYLSTKKTLHNRVMFEAAPLSPKSIISIYVTEDDIAAIDNYVCESCGKSQRMRVGIAKPAGVEVDFEDVQAGPSGYTWTAAAESTNAVAMRIHFTDFSLPAGSELYVYNTMGEIFGPYTDNGPNGSGDFWSHTVTGSFVYIQVMHKGEVSRKMLKDSHFVVQDVAHMGEKFLLPFLQQKRPQRDTISRIESFCSFNEWCVEDAGCYGTGDWGAINDARYGVAHMQFIDGAWIYICTGGLLADTDPATQIPYFLTANHCIDKESIADTLECYWQFWTSSCGGACYDPIGVVPRTLGAAINSTDSTGDYTLMTLDENPPSGSVFLGWNSTAVAFNNGYQLYRISHPSGAPQAFSKHQVDTGKGTCSGWPRGDWIYSHDLIGATEGGSSGSPVLNSVGEVVGQLSGACGTNVNDPCDAVSNATVDGAFASYFSQVSPWLDPGTSNITLNATKRYERRRWYVDLTWSGATGTRVNIYLNGTLLRRVRNTGSYSHNVGRSPSGTYTYKVCEVAGTPCSNDASVTF